MYIHDVRYCNVNSFLMSVATAKLTHDSIFCVLYINCAERVTNSIVILLTCKRMVCIYNRVIYIIVKWCVIMYQKVTCGNGLLHPHSHKWPWMKELCFWMGNHNYLDLQFCYSEVFNYFSQNINQMHTINVLDLT